MKILWSRDYYDLEIAGVHFYCTCFVRNEISPQYKRRLHDPKEVIRTITADRKKGSPYMPRKFPTGEWEITAIERNGVGCVKFDEKEYGPVRIRTTATQKVEVWALDAAGGYDHPTGVFVDDYGYLLHWTPSRTTLGCGRVGKENTNQVEVVARLIAPHLEKNGFVSIKVV